jgi:cardiolipin synthase A/B
VNGLAWWILIPAIIGVLAIVTAIVTLFFSLGRRPDALRAEPPPSLDEPDDFLLAIAGAVNAPTRAGGTAELLSNGDAFFPAILEAIGSARQSVNFFTYMFDDSPIATQVLEALTRKAVEGVEVRLLLDAFGGMKVDDDLVGALVGAGGRVKRFRPPRLGKLTRFHRRNHRRAIVVDGEIGFTGGASVAEEWMGNGESPEHWRDDMIRVTGTLARSLQSAFAQAWGESYGEILVGKKFYPFFPDGGRGSGEHEISQHVNIVSSPADDAHPMRKLFLLTFMAARKRIWLTAAYFAPDEHLRDALAQQARAGIDVRLLLANEHTDLPLVRWAGHSYFEELLEAGVRIFEYQPTFIHSKLLVVDGRWSVVGSANMDVRSKELNEENVIGLLDPGFAAQLEDRFRKDLSSSTEIRLHQWRLRPWHHRLREEACELLAEQL